CIQGGTCIGLGGDYDDPLLFEFTHPADHVPWFDAQAYCNWVGSRLPTEAEWEKAARGGLEGRKYPWGDQRPSCDNGAENGANFGCGSSVTSVGSYAPNGYGLYDMAGNVREWVSDIYEADYYSTSPSSNPTGPSEGTFMVLRGGSSRWSTGEDSIATFYRSRLIPVNEPNDFGFRCVRDVTP
ncbi:MAG: SUMF1/EgtB/PvdO family nonheme iron enzyme, partial [Anaerolineae bacterium]|nr:SUMF1/EgtB/PvdO family nonheme iron enzyme [Anaerolineae bacterium]